MLRIAAAIIVGFFAWLILWIACEQILSAIFPAWFGAQQQAFQAALTDGGQFTPQTSFLLTHIASAFCVSLLAGFLAALVADENRRAPLILGILLLALGLLKAALSWSLVPVWYHITFTALLLPLAVLGSKLKTSGNAVLTKIEN